MTPRGDKTEAIGAIVCAAALAAAACAAYVTTDTTPTKDACCESEVILTKEAATPGEGAPREDGQMYYQQYTEVCNAAAEQARPVVVVLSSDEPREPTGPLQGLALVAWLHPNAQAHGYHGKTNRDIFAQVLEWKGASPPCALCIDTLTFGQSPITAWQMMDYETTYGGEDD